MLIVSKVLYETENVEISLHYTFTLNTFFLVASITKYIVFMKKNVSPILNPYLISKGFLKVLHPTKCPLVQL